MDVDLADMVTIVTGGGRGLGAAATRRFLAEGSAVTVLDVAVTEESPGAVFVGTDITDEEQVRSAVAQTLAVHGRIDTLVNCAGVIGPLGQVQDIPADLWRRTLEVNLTGTFVTCAAVLGAMVEQGGGRIVNFASAAGVEHQAGQAPYNASKAAVISLTKTLARESYRQGIRVNAVCPANVNTALIREFLDQDVSSLPEEVKENQRAHGEASAQGLVWEPEDVMDLVVFLASPAGARLSGQFLRMGSKGEPGVFH